MKQIKTTFDHSKDHGIPKNVQQRLAPRELDVVISISKGFYSQQEIADTLAMAHSTAGDHLKIIYRKLNINDRFKLIKLLFPDVGNDDFQRATKEWSELLALSPKESTYLSSMFGCHSRKSIARDICTELNTANDHESHISIKYKEAFKVAAGVKVSRLGMLHELLMRAREMRDDRIAPVASSAQITTAHVDKEQAVSPK